MSRWKPFRRVLLSVAFVCVTLVGVSHRPWRLLGADAPADGSLQSSPITAPGLVDVTDRVDVTIPSTLRVTGRNKYSVRVTVKNKGDEPLAGALLLVVRGVKPLRLAAKGFDSQSDVGLFFELIGPQETLAARSKTRPKRIAFESDAPLGPQARRLVKLDYRVVQKVAKPSATEDRKAGRSKPTERRQADRLNPLRDSGGSGIGNQPNVPAAQTEVRLDPTPKNIERVTQVQDKWTDRLMEKAGVVGTATGLDRDGKLTVKVFAVHAGVKGLPNSIDGIPLKRVVTGALHARWQSEERVNPRQRFDRPVPIGVSTGNSRSGATGTISCRLRDEDGLLYSLSNNHVTSFTNRGRVGDEIAQPGRADSQGRFDPENVIGTLSGFVEIRFGSYSNQIDAAVTLVTSDTQGTSTPGNGYGTPVSTTRRPRLGMRVQKYGRTTSLTKGRITSINAVVSVDYGRGRLARFVKQIVVTGDRAGFIKGGDSGSLLVTDPRRAPVGLLFAGSRGGRTAIANRIDTVLDAFDASIDDGSEVGKNEPPPVKPPPVKPTPPRLPKLPGRGGVNKLPIVTGHGR